MRREQACAAAVDAAADRLQLSALLLLQDCGLRSEVHEGLEVAGQPEEQLEPAVCGGTRQNVGTMPVNPGCAAGISQALDAQAAAWPAAEFREWELRVCPYKCNGTIASRPDSRMFVQHAGGHTRIALTLVSDP
jgi:hypothetical protein